MLLCIICMTMPHGSACMQVLKSSRPLASYGVGGGSLLQLQPMEPQLPRQLPWGSPPLSSPEHQLVRQLSCMLSASNCDISKCMC